MAVRGGAQFVGGVRGEAAHLLERLLQAGEQVVEGDRQLADLVVRVGDRQPRTQPFGMDGARLGHHVRDGTQGTPGERITAKDGREDRQWQAQTHDPE